ncbi:MAG TPA: hypothetical protein PLX33_12825 [Alphaproteobacteria bacterium]|nr:hypothetical protein [Alphaproteobacteria bacterium]
MSPSASRTLRLAFAATAAAALLTGCDMRNNDIGPTAERDELKGSTLQEQVFTGGPLQPHTTLSARFLKPGQRYYAQGSLTIEGDIPEKTSITVKHGELTVKGDVGKEARLDAAIPLVTHTEHWRGPGYCYRPLKGSFGYSAFCSHSKTIVDGMKYDDADPAIRVTGRAHETAKLSSAGAIEVRGTTLQPAQYPVYVAK